MPMHTPMKNRIMGAFFLARGQNLIPACPYPSIQIFNRQFLENVKGKMGEEKRAGPGDARHWPR